MRNNKGYTYNCTFSCKLEEYLEYIIALATWAQIIALPVAIIAIIVTIWVAWQNRQKRAIACEFQSVEFPLEIKTNETIDGDIEVRYRGQKIDN